MSSVLLHSRCAGSAVDLPEWKRRCLIGVYYTAWVPFCIAALPVIAGAIVLIAVGLGLLVVSNLFSPRRQTWTQTPTATLATNGKTTRLS
jgi:hypothetical protein